MESRYDFYRILLPGAIMLGLVDVAIRLTTLGAPADVKAQAANALQFVEDPVRGVVIAFAFGIGLYFTEPGYNAPQFFYRIPSTHLHNILTDRYPDEPDLAKHSVSLYFRALDELVPDGLRERALLYGAFYRIGFQSIFFTLALAAALPACIVMVGGAQPRSDWVDPGAAAWLMLGAPMLVGTAAFVSALLPSRHPYARRLGGRFVSVVILAMATSAISWWTFVHPDAGPSFLFKNSDWVVGVATALHLTAWCLLRLRGPIRPFLRSLWVSKSTRPDRPHSDAQIALLDFSVVLPALSGLLVLGSEIDLAQILGVCALGTIALLLSAAKKHERRLAGIYANQNRWLDANLERVVALANPMRAGPDATTARGRSDTHLSGKVEIELSGTGGASRSPRSWRERFVSALARHQRL